MLEFPGEGRTEWPASRLRVASVFASWGCIAEDFRSESAHRQDFCIVSHRRFLACLARVATHIASLPASRDMGHSEGESAEICGFLQLSAFWVSLSLYLSLSPLFRPLKRAQIVWKRGEVGAYKVQAYPKV